MRSHEWDRGRAAMGELYLHAGGAGGGAHSKPRRAAGRHVTLYHAVRPMPQAQRGPLVRAVADEEGRRIGDAVVS